MDTSALLQAVLAAVLPVVATAATAYLIRAWQDKKAILSQNQWALLNWVINAAVWAAEQAWRSGLIQKSLRLDYATNMIQQEINARGLPSVDIKQLEALCGAAVAQQFNSANIVVQPPTLPSSEVLSKVVTSSQ